MTGPVVAELGTTATICVLLHDVIVDAATPLKLTVLVPWVAPNPVPLIATEVPKVPTVGETLETFGAGITVKLTPLLATADTVTTTFPVVAAVGTGVTIVVADQLVGLAAVPLKVTVLRPWEVPKLVPEIVTDVPVEPEVGERVEIVGVGTTVKLIPLLASPPTVTTKLPVDAPAGTGTTMPVIDQLLGVAATPLNVTELVP